MFMWQETKRDRSKSVTTLFAAILFLCVLFLSSAFAQHDPEKEKEKRLKRNEAPKTTPPRYKPPRHKAPREVEKAPPLPDKPEKKVLDKPEKDPEPPAPSPPLAPPTTGFSAISVDLSSLQADLTDDPELHIFIDDIELARKQRPASEAQFILEAVPVGNHTLKITHPMIKEFTYTITVQQASVTVNYLNLEFDIIRHRLIIYTEPLAQVCINDDCRESDGQDGVTVFYLAPQDPYNIKIMKNGYQVREEKKQYLDKPETILDLPLIKKLPGK